MIYCCLDIFSQPVTIQFSLILLATRMRSVPYNINRTIWENTERSRDAEIFNYIYTEHLLDCHSPGLLKSTGALNQQPPLNDASDQLI